MSRCYYRNNVLGTNDDNVTSVLSSGSCNNNNNTCNRNVCLMDVLCDFLGCLCNCQFDTQASRNLEEVNGILEEVGENYLILRSTNSGRKTICNTDNLQFINLL